MRLAYADPPYPGCAALYRDHPDYAGEVDHAALIARLESEFDGWVLHTNATPSTMRLLAPLVPDTARWMSWVKGFAAFKKNVSVAYAWEPVIVKAARKPVVSTRLVMRDWVQESITLKRGLTGAKPEAVCHWAFEVLGARPEDDLVDLFPGTGAVTRAWDTWRRKFTLPANHQESLCEAADEIMKLRTALGHLMWAASERDKRNRIRQFDEFMDEARALLSPPVNPI